MRIPFFAAMLLAVISGRCEAQVLIYKVHFENAPQTPQFEFYDGGWIIVDLNSYEVSFVFTDSGNGSNKQTFIASKASGEFFYSSLDEDLSGNIRAFSNSQTSQASYLLTGNIDATMPSIDPVSKKEILTAVPGSMSGFLLASETESYHATSATTSEALNVVGIVKLEAELDEKFSEYYNKNEISADMVTDYVIEDLMAIGFEKDQ